MINNYSDDQTKKLQILINGTKYRESMCIALIEMFKEGKTAAQFCSKYNIGKETFYKWKKKHKLFGAACAIGEQHARSYYDCMRQNYLLEEASGLKVNWGSFNKMYSARFNIADKRTVRVKGLGRSKDERQMLKCLTKALEAQELTPDEYSKLLGIVDTSLKVKQASELEDRLKALEDSTHS